MKWKRWSQYLELKCENSIEKESLDPKHICQVFQKTIENIEIDIEVKLVFYKLFDQEVCSKLEVMYKTLNKIFIDNDIMPEIMLKSTKQEEVENDEDEVSTQVASYYDPTVNKSTNFIPLLGMSFNYLNRFLVHQHSKISMEKIVMRERKF